MKHATSHSRRNMKISHNTQRTNQKCTAENVIVFSPTTCPSSEKKGNDSGDKISGATQKKQHSGGGGILNFNLKKLTNLDLDHLLDHLLSDDLILIALISVLIIERYNLKKSGADKNKLSDYDLTIMALLYIFF